MSILPLLKKKILAPDIKMELRSPNKDPLIWVYPPMYAKTKTGGIKWYEIEIHNKKTHYEIHRRKASVIGGKAQLDITEVHGGVNVGKKNATTPVAQAILEANSLVSRLKDKGYKSSEDLGIDPLSEGLQGLLEVALSDTNTDAQGRIKPMLATHDEAKIVFPCTTQPKYNGVRSVAIRETSEVILLSRNGKRYYIDRVQKLLMEKMKPGEVWDGELYSHTLTFQEIIEAVRTVNTKHVNQDKIIYVVYDVPSGKKWEERRKDVYNLTAKLKIPPFHVAKKGQVCTSAVQITYTDSCRDEKELELLHKINASNHFEGTMVRNLKGLYEYGYRSRDLIKKKDFVDAEFKIINVVEAKGRNAGTPVFVLQVGHNNFSAVPKGDTAYRQKLWKDRKALIGKKATVQFQNYSDDGVPIFPVLIAIRNYE